MLCNCLPSFLMTANKITINITLSLLLFESVVGVNNVPQLGLLALDEMNKLFIPVFVSLQYYVNVHSQSLLQYHINCGLIHKSKVFTRIETQFHSCRQRTLSTDITNVNAIIHMLL